MEAVATHLGSGPVVASWKSFAKNFITMNVLSMQPDHAKHLAKIKKAISALGDDDAVRETVKAMGGCIPEDMQCILKRKQECVAALQEHESSELDEMLQTAGQALQSLNQSIAMVKEEYDKAKDDGDRLANSWLPMMDGTKSSRRSGKCAVTSAADLVSKQEKVDETKLSIEKLNKLRPTEEGEAMVKNLSSACLQGQAYIVLYAACAQMLNSNFGKDCAEGKTSRDAIFGMQEVLNSDAVMEADDNFMASVLPVMASWGYDMKKADRDPAD